MEARGVPEVDGLAEELCDSSEVPDADRLAAEVSVTEGLPDADRLAEPLWECDELAEGV